MCLILIVAAGFLLRASLASDLHLHEWDERYHALVAKNLIAHPWRPTLYEDTPLAYDYRSWTSNHIWLHKEPLALWLMAASMRFFGVSEIALRLPSLIFSMAAVACTYFLARSMFGAPTGFIAAGLHAINGKLVELSAGRTASDHVDSVFIALVAIGGWLAVKRRSGGVWGSAVTIGVIAGLAALTKSPMGFMVILLWVILFRPEGANRIYYLLGGAALAVAVALVVYLPWHIFTGIAYPHEAAWERAYTFRHITEVLEGHGGGVTYYLKQIPRHYGELAIFSLAWFFCRSYKEPGNRAKAMLALWIGVPYLFFSVAKTKMPAYPMIAAPAVFTIVAWHYWKLHHAASRTAGWRRVAAIVIAALLLLLPVRYSLERMKPMWNTDWNTPWASSMRELGDTWPGVKAVVFNVNRPIELMFYTSATAYSHVPSEREVIRAVKDGYRVCVLDDGSLPSWVWSHPMIDVLPAGTIADGGQ
jgi:4-amino-4-deoxy-L-arabinose transferase